MIEANQVLIDAISAEIKIKNPTATPNEIIDSSQKVVDIFEKINGGIMQLEDVTKEIIDFCLKMAEKSNDLVSAKKSIVDSIDVILLSIDKLLKGLESLDRGFNGVSMPANTVIKDMNQNKISSSNFKSSKNIIDSLFDIVKKSVNVTKNFVKTVFGNISSFISNVFKTITNPFKKIGSMLIAPFKFLDNLIKSPFKAISGLKDKISDKIGAARDAIPFTALSGGPAKRDREDDYKIAGITSRALSENLVLKRSAAGVAVFWLYKKMAHGGAGSTKGVSGDGGWLDTLADAYLVGEGINKLLKGRVLKWALNVVKNPWFYGTALIAAGAATAYFLGKSRINAMEKRGETPESILGVKKATGYQKTVVRGSEAVAGNVGKGTFKERAMNAVKNAGWGGSIGALIGGGLGAFAGPGGVAAGAMLGAKLGIAIGASTGFAGGKDLAKGINAASEGVKGLVTASKAEAATMETATNNINSFNKSLKEGTEKALPSFWDSLKEFFFGKSKTPKPQGASPGSGGGHPVQTQTGSPKTATEVQQVNMGKSGVVDPKSIGKNIPVDVVSAFISKQISEGHGKKETKRGITKNEDVNNIRDEFMGTIKNKVTNPYALAAIEATVQRESAWKRKSMTGDWDDLGEKSGGLMSWRGDRLKGLRAFAQKNKLSLDSAETQAMYFMHEQKKNLNDLNAAKSPEDAARMMANLWRFKDYKGGTELNARIAKTKEYVGKYTPTVAKVEEPPKIDVTASALKAQEVKKASLTSQNDLTSQMVEHLSNLGKQMAKSVSIQEDQKTATDKTDNSSQVKVASNPNEIPKYIMEMIFGMNSGGENNSLGIL